MLGFSSASRRPVIRLAALLFVAIAMVPAVFVASTVIPAIRDVAYWDELDTAVALVLQLDAGMGWSDFFQRLFELSNEHRMVTSRLMFAASYWLTGTVNFAVINLIGNASLVALCGVLLYAAGTMERRVRLALLLAMLMFQLQHYENLLWSGSSIDHFQVVLLAALAVVGVARGTRPGLLGAALCALLATFTLAHGMIAWAIGFAMLWRERRFGRLALWSALGSLAIAGFFFGFQVNAAQHFAEFSAGGALLVARYWLALMGSVPAIGNMSLAPWLGGLLLAALAWVAFRGALRRERVAFPLACYAVAALGLIAVGRAAESGGVIHSRYYVLSALAWALVAFMALERQSHPRRPFALLWGALPLLVAFNFTANQRFAPKADSWLECRDRAAVRFKQHGVDGRGSFSLYPAPARSTALLKAAEERGVYRMPPICEEREFPDAHPSSRIAYFVEDITVSGRSASVGGWAAIPGVKSKRGQIHVVLRSGNEMHVFTSVTITRPDVAAALKQPDCVLAGFLFARSRALLPTGEYQVGFLIKDGHHTEYIMTGHRLRLVGEGQALLASAD